MQECHLSSSHDNMLHLLIPISSRFVPHLANASLMKQSQELFSEVLSSLNFVKQGSQMQKLKITSIKSCNDAINNEPFLQVLKKITVLCLVLKNLMKHLIPMMLQVLLLGPFYMPKWTRSKVSVLEHLTRPLPPSLPMKLQIFWDYQMQKEH